MKPFYFQRLKWPELILLVKLRWIYMYQIPHQKKWKKGTSICKPSHFHATTSILPKGKFNFAHPTESLILSKMDYNDIVFYALPLNLIKRLQRVYNAGTGLVLGRHATPKDITKMSWLLFEKVNSERTLEDLHDALDSIAIGKHLGKTASRLRYWSAGRTSWPKSGANSSVCAGESEKYQQTRGMPTSSRYTRTMMTDALLATTVGASPSWASLESCLRELHWRASGSTQRVYSECQCGICVDIVFSLTQLQKKCREQRLLLFVAFHRHDEGLLWYRQRG